MSEAIQATLFRRMRHTPMRDALRGRITGRLDIERRLIASNLPIPAQQLIRHVVKRTRLWRIEKADLAGELIAHFLDGIDAGEPVDELIASFGDERAAARLIGRAKRRNRGVVWQALIALRWIACGMIVFYMLSAIYFYSGSPSINVNYVDRLNAPLQDVPADELAWPLYRQAIPNLRDEPTRVNDEGDALLDATPGSSHWPRAIEWLQAHEREIELARRASQQPALGFVFGPEGSIRDSQMWPAVDPALTEPDPLLINVLLPHLNDMRQVARVLHADARLAREQGDTPRLLRNIAALIGVADQLRDGQFLIDDLIALGIRDLALVAVRETLAHPTVRLTPEQLQQLAHGLARPASAAELISFEGERMTIRDIVQHLYTDDGQGNGRLTPEGARLLQQFTRPSPRESTLLPAAAAPMLPLTAASRQELTAATEQVIDLAQANLSRPMREAQWDAYQQRVLALRSSVVDRLRYAPVLGNWSGYGQLFPALNGAHASAERYLGQRDGTIVALALETYRQQHGQYPQTLDLLAPSLLPHVPVDRITGGPLHYRVAEGRPLIYSVGADRDDDGGRAPLDKGNYPASRLAAKWNVTPDKAPDGDWVLYGGNE